MRKVYVRIYTLTSISDLIRKKSIKKKYAHGISIELDLIDVVGFELPIK